MRLVREELAGPTADADEAHGPGMTLRLPRALVSPNQWNGRHWRVKHRLSQEWEWELIAARRGPRQPASVRMRVTITRAVPNGRHVIRDDDNLRFCVKPLLDALTRQGFIRDDSRQWIDLPTPVQVIAPDGGAWTQIELEEA